MAIMKFYALLFLVGLSMVGLFPLNVMANFNTDLQQFINTVRTLLCEIDSEMTSLQQNRERCEFYANRILCCLQHLSNIIAFMNVGVNSHQTQVIELESLRTSLNQVHQSLTSSPAMDMYSYRPLTEPRNGPGRPRYALSRAQLGCLRNEFSSWTQIASDLGVSRQTIYNRRRELGFSLDFEHFSNISDSDLDTLVRQIQQEFPQSGETNTIAGLRQRNIYLPRWRVRQSIIRVDPINRANRWGQRIRRRPYSVPHPNYLWHIDTHMKLRHWRLCIHGCIDGYSRSIIYLKVNNNNKATTVLKCFQDATREWGHPSRVRSDDGGENIAVGEYMTWYRGQNRGSFLTGPSVRNTRIERLWRDMFASAIFIFYSLFIFMEQQQILDAANNLHVFALHYIYMPRIQRLLDRFVARFNVHSISTERNRTPRQLWASGCLRMFHAPTFDILDDPHMYGDDPDAPPPDPDNEAVGVEIDPVNITFQEEVLAVMRQQFDPLFDDGNYGFNLFLQVVEYLRHFTQHP